MTPPPPAAQSTEGVCKECGATAAGRGSRGGFFCHACWAKWEKQRSGTQTYSNTESYTPDTSVPAMRVHVVTDACPPFDHRSDVVVVPHLVCTKDDWALLAQLKAELAGGDWQTWHGDSHAVCTDPERSPTFRKIVAQMAAFFNMEVAATRCNMYRGTADWKPYHHDRAAFDPDGPQNFTCGLSLGATRELSFLHSQSRAVVAFPMTNGNVTVFGRDVNINWKHGIRPPSAAAAEDATSERISTIAWGWVADD